MQNEQNREPVAASGRFEAADEELLMDFLEEYARREGWDTQRSSYGSTAVPVLQIGVPELGRIKVSAAAELSFLHPQGAQGSFTTAQMVATVFSDIPEENLEEVMRACSRVNRYALVGGFGLLEHNLYYRQNLLLRPDYPFAVCGQMLVDALISLHRTVDITIDGFALIARGMNTLPEMVEQGFLD